MRRVRLGWHPWLFIFSFGTGCAALVAGDGLVALIMGFVAVALVVW